MNSLSDLGRKPSTVNGSTLTSPSIILAVRFRATSLLFEFGVGVTVVLLEGLGVGNDADASLSFVSDLFLIFSREQVIRYFSGVGDAEQSASDSVLQT